MKVALAKECYETVDFLIVRLDRDLSALDSEFMKARLTAMEEAAACEPPPGAAAGGKKGGKKGMHHPHALRQAALCSALPAPCASRIGALQAPCPLCRCRLARWPPRKRRLQRCTRFVRTWKSTPTSRRIARARECRTAT